MLLENGFGKVFPGPHLSQSRYPRKQGIKQIPVSLSDYVMSDSCISQTDRHHDNNNDNIKMSMAF